MAELSSNKRGLFDYEILDEYEAGIQLLGFEVKSAKLGRMNIAGSYTVVRGNEAWLLNASIPPYQAANNPEAYDPLRTRKLLLKKPEIKELTGKSAQKGLTIIPIRVYTKQGKIKILIGIARHKKTKDKRETIKKREAKREIERIIKRG
jgi:SsrA-binding protein